MLPASISTNGVRFKEAVDTGFIPRDLEHLYDSFDQEMAQNEQTLNRLLGESLKIGDRFQLWHQTSQRFLSFDEIRPQELARLTEDLT